MILFVDDEARLMDSYREELELSPFKVTYIKRTDEALKFFEENVEQIEMLILDIMMPPGGSFKNEDTEQGLRTGLRFFERVKQQSPDLPIIIFTNVSDPGVKEYFVEKDKCWFFRKEDYLPFELAEQVKAIMENPGT